MSDNNAALIALYRTAEKARALAPWRWMYETQVFGIRLPDQPYTWYCSIMGHNGEHLSYCFYKGERGLATYVALQTIEDFDSPNILYFQKAMLLKQEAIQVTFDDYEDTLPESRKRIKSLGLKYRGPKQWVNILDWTEGLSYWPIEAEMAPLVQTLLEQAMQVATEQGNNHKYLGYWVESGKTMPVFIAEKTDGGITWTKKRQKVVTPDEIEAPFKPLIDWSALRQLPIKNKTLLFGVLITFQQVAPDNDPKGRPFHPTIYLLLDLATQEIMGIFLDNRDASKDLQQQIFSGLKSLKYRPKELIFGEPVSYVQMSPLMEAAGIKPVLQTGMMPILETISQFMIEQM
jgi:hypothetical protein